MVYVLDTDGTPLMPTQRHYRVRFLLKKKEATVVCTYPFTIRLSTDKPRHTKNVSLGIDCGTRHIGVSATTETKVLYSAEAILRVDTTKLIATRKGLRRTRRNRLRYRPARFNNRVSTKKKGWLPPSILNKVAFHAKVVKYVRKLLPVSKIILEVAPFDIQKLLNPDIKGTDYQHGEQEGSYNTREYVLYRDRHECQYCHGKSGDKILNVHHIESRKTGGNAPNNLVTLCETCHDAYHRGEIKLNIKRGKSMRDAAGMNLIKDRLYEVVKKENNDITVRYTYGYITKYSRIKYGIKKSHTNDAQVISGNPKAKLCCDTWELRQIRRHNRQIHKSNILKGGKLKRNHIGYCVKGYHLWDLVRYKGNLYLIKAKRSSGSFCLMGLDGEKRDGVGYRHLRIVTICNRLIKINKNRECDSSHG